MHQTVAVLGASANPERYSHKALSLLLEYGHRVFPVHPKVQEILGIPVKSRLSAITEKVDTISIYVNQNICKEHLTDIIALKPKRVILNPGTESEEIKSTLLKNNISVQEACTLVLLKTNQF